LLCGHGWRNIPRVKPNASSTEERTAERTHAKDSIG
jgi:hypothetical protein